MTPPELPNAILVPASVCAEPVPAFREDGFPLFIEWNHPKGLDEKLDYVFDSDSTCWHVRLSDFMPFNQSSMRKVEMGILDPFIRMPVVRHNFIAVIPIVDFVGVFQRADSKTFIVQL